jgi:uncharacterized protein (TIGR00369 family)
MTTAPDLETYRAIFRRAAFIADLGVELDAVSEGQCETSLAVQPRHLQHSGQVHAGVLTTLADHTAGAAAQTLAPEGMFVATVEMKISLLRPAKGERLVCRGRVLKPGRQLSFVEAEVHCVDGGKEHLVAKVTATMAMISQKNLV